MFSSASVATMTDAGDRGGGLPGRDGAAGDQHGRREPSQDVMDPRGPMGMPIIVSRAAAALGRRHRGAANVAAGIFVLSVFAIIVALGIFLIV
jgi:hypothetical protein